MFASTLQLVTILPNHKQAVIILTMTKVPLLLGMSEMLFFGLVLYHQTEGRFQYLMYRFLQ